MTLRHPEMSSKQLIKYFLIKLTFLFLSSIVIERNSDYWNPFFFFFGKTEVKVILSTSI